MAARISTPLIFIALTATLASCFGGVSPHIVRPIEPTVPGWFGGRVPVVASLRPTFRWEPLDDTPHPDATWDLIIYRAVPYNSTDRHLLRGSVVYSREGLGGTEHQLEDDLNPATVYIWSVRLRNGADVGEWADYSYWMVSLVPIPGLIGYGKESDLYLLFRTER